MISNECLRFDDFANTAVHKHSETDEEDEKKKTSRRQQRNTSITGCSFLFSFHCSINDMTHEESVIIANLSSRLPHGGKRTNSC